MRTIFIPTGLKDLPFLQVVLKKIENSVVWHKSLDGRTVGTDSRSIESGLVSLHASEMDNGVMVNLKIHHALYDAVSLPRLLNTLARLCTEREPHIHRSDLSKLIAFQYEHSSLMVRKQFWKEYLSDVDSRPRLNHRPENPGEIQRYYHPALVTDIARVEAIARYHSLSIQSLFLAIYAKIHSQVIAKGTGDDQNCRTMHDHVVGVYLANRAYPLEGLPELIAPTLNMVPLRIRGGSISSIVQTAHQIQSDLHEISRVEHSGVSLIEISDWTGVRLDVFVNFLRLPGSDDETETLSTIDFAPADPKEFDAHSNDGPHGGNGALESSDGVNYLADIYSVIARN
jgi:hypothetical protein